MQAEEADVHSIDEIMDARVEELIVAEVQVLLAADEVAEWGIGDRDWRALTEFGLPLVDSSQFVPEPTPGPSTRMFGELEGYYLGMLRRLDVCLVRNSGQVVGVPNDGFSSPAFINSSASQYVESSWRYYWLHRSLTALPVTLQTYEDLQAFVDRIVERDPMVGSDASVSFWPGVVEGW